jgi:hypothetical protein
MVTVRHVVRGIPQKTRGTDDESLRGASLVPVELLNRKLYGCRREQDGV